MKKTIQAQDIFVIGDQRQLIVHLASFEWDFTPGLTVELSQGDISIVTRQVGSGNHEGRAVLVLAPLESWVEAEDAVCRMRKTDEKPITLSLKRSAP